MLISGRPPQLGYVDPTQGFIALNFWMTDETQFSRMWRACLSGAFGSIAIGDFRIRYWDADLQAYDDRQLPDNVGLGSGRIDPAYFTTETIMAVQVGYEP